MASDYARQVDADREAWREETVDFCMWCGASGGSSFGFNRLQIHEIERKSHASGRWGVRCNYLLLCPKCHGEVFDTLPHAHQLAVKLMNDPAHFDLDEWLRLRDPALLAPERVTLEEIVQYLDLRNSYE